MLQMAQGMLESPLAKAVGQVTKTHEVTALVCCGYPGPRLRSHQLSWKGRWDYSTQESPCGIQILGCTDDKHPLGPLVLTLLLSVHGVEDLPQFLWECQEACDTFMAAHGGHAPRILRTQ